MNPLISTNISQNFSILNRYFNLIQMPLDTKHFMENKISLINNLNLNITNYKLYYPIILDALEKNESCADLYGDFEQINEMSMYIYTIIEEDMTKNIYLDTNLDLNYLHNLLKFINQLLTSFHRILNQKIALLNDNITEDEYNKEYEDYTIEFGEQRTYFYSTIFNEKSEGLSENVRRVWKTEL